VGDINKIVTYILLAVFFALLFATGTTMLQSIRERVPELAVLKTLGYADGAILVLVLSESVALCLLASLAGLCLAYLLFPLLKDSLGMAYMPPSVVAEGIALAALLAFVTGFIPAWRAKQLVIVEALRA
jgi:putative ABC transport system permease protein